MKVERVLVAHAAIQRIGIGHELRREDVRRRRHDVGRDGRGAGLVAHAAGEAREVSGARFEHALDPHAFGGEIGGAGAAMVLRAVGADEGDAMEQKARRVGAEGAGAWNQHDRAALRLSHLRVGMILVDDHVVAEIVRRAGDLDAPRVVVHVGAAGRMGRAELGRGSSFRPSRRIRPRPVARHRCFSSCTDLAKRTGRVST